MSMREEFEAWAIESGETALSKAHMLKSEDGEYYNYAAKTYWKAWQASRAALAIDIGEGTPAGEFREGAKVISISEAIARIEAAGVQVKS
ncbi:hypothetical protein EAW52_10630 [Pseudomonas sp. LTJR-52]|uniref:hypothetical protein n=1 Tax=Pseudomonas sp. LTJR-52 TaxID=2479392 RepID=UPI000EFD76BC|nr:hypothetical protein [Pseudomonas sp. LTJR-52]AYN94382.1 hypothetical protein EAW52_10630 [Pseudomonas sp. LTJR-52]